VSRADDGAATVWALIVVLLVWAMAAVCAVETAAVQARHRSAAAADAAALAAASPGGLDGPTGCAAARRAAARLGAEVTDCALSGPFATVTVRLPSPPPIRWAGPVTARARAGPADTGQTGAFSHKPDIDVT
jgi:secretion/DNA translocation related TadE-like protein